MMSEHHKHLIGRQATFWNVPGVIIDACFGRVCWFTETKAFDMPRQWICVDDAVLVIDGDIPSATQRRYKSGKAQKITGDKQ